jgi:DNA-binding transcriptional ArsR family regulator
MNINSGFLASVLKTLGDASRLRILFSIGKNSLSVSRIVEETGMSQPLVSHHLRFLKASRLVTTERKGPFIYYRLSDPKILDFIREGHDLALLLEKRGPAA